MRYWFLAMVILVANSSFAYNFTPNTQCVLCSTVIRCGPGVDAVIRPNQSGGEMTVEKHCAQISNERDPKYRELRNIFSKNRFTYQEYLDKVPVLAERRIDVTPKPLIGPNELLNTSRASDLQNYTDYILDAVDPKQDKNLEVNADGKLVNKLDRQPQRVRDDLKARMPSSENAAVKRNGAWVSPEQEPYINPLSKESSGAKTKRSAVTPIPTPVEWWDDSFRRNYCRGKTIRECDDLWVLRNQKEEKPKSKEEKPVSEKPAPTKSSTSVPSSIPNTSMININSPTSSFGSDGLGAGSARMPSSLASATAQPSVTKPSG